MPKILSLSCLLLLSIALGGCRSTTGNIAESNVPANAAQTSKTPNAPPKAEPTVPIEVAKLAGRSPAELDQSLGAPQQSEPIENGGEYRLYKIAGQSKGLAVRFYGGRARSFNLISDEPAATSRDALKKFFNIDVGKTAPLKDANEPLSEIYRGAFGGVKFKKVSAKKQAAGKGFIFVLAEVSE